MSDVERRYTPGMVETRADARRIGGYGAVFGKLSRNLGGFVENIAAGAFNKSRADGWNNVVARYNHDSNMVLGTTGGRTLDLRVDEAGLWYEVEPPQSRGDILELVSRGDVAHSSFAFRVAASGDEWSVTDQKFPMRTLHEVQLVDVAPVLEPAYPDTTAGLRSLATHFETTAEEIRSMAEADELGKLFIRSDRDCTTSGRRRIFGPAAAADLLARRADPWA